MKCLENRNSRDAEFRGDVYRNGKDLKEHRDIFNIC